MSTSYTQRIQHITDASALEALLVEEMGDHNKQAIIQARLDRVLAQPYMTVNRVSELRVLRDEARRLGKPTAGIEARLAIVKGRQRQARDNWRKAHGLKIKSDYLGVAK